MIEIVSLIMLECLYSNFTSSEVCFAAMYVVIFLQLIYIVACVSLSILMV